MDNETLKRIETAHPAVRDELKKIYSEICERLTGKAICRFAFVHRSFEEQQKLYDQGRITPGQKVTNARGGQSYHNYGLAVDVVLLIDKDGNGTHETASWDMKSDFDGDGQSDWQEIVFVFEMYGWEWGGRWAKFPDGPHFQKTYGYNIADLLGLHKSNKFITGTKYVDIA